LTKLVGSEDGACLLYSVLPLRSLFALARWHGRLAHGGRHRQRLAVRRNLETVFGGEKSAAELDGLTRAFFEQRAARGLLLAIAPRLTSSEMTRLFPLDGLEHLDAASQRQRGVILLGSHLNSLVMFNAIIMLRDRGYDVGVALPEARDPWAPSRLGAILARLFGTRPMRELTGAFYAQFNIRPIVRALGEGVIVAQTGDGLHSARFVEVDFLGRKVPFPTGMLRVAQATGAVVVPVFQVGEPPEGLRIVVEEPLTVEREGGEEPLTSAVAEFVRLLERHLRTSIASWEHWLIDDTLGTMAAWPQRSLEERYKV
jgi:KDO2-lipid IV(A) lauroyltransferase